ncbi:MAG: aspartate aminotransferase family protein, partial [Hyphomicrobiales bacterium]|nr:aspartate aminotransferase family protein [Hyphomicrobiales bacterium]
MSNLFYQSKSTRPMLDHAEGIYMWDTSGKRYIDGSSGAMVSNIGHSNPAVLAAMRAQMEKSTFGYRLHFQTESSEALARKTADLAPEGLNKVFFVSGGSEAVESTVKLARQYVLTRGEAQRYKVISRYPSYHGCTLGALAITGYPPMSAPFDPMMRAMPKIPAPRAYLDGLDADDPATGLHYADMLEAKILEEGPETVLAFIVEPVGGASTGALVSPAGYMRRIREICTQYGVLLIHDEVMTGGGRTGHFFGAEHWDVTPDLIALSKGFGGGYIPLGAMVARDDIVEAVMDAGGFIHGFTYAGNPLACAAGAAVLDQIEQNDLTGNAARMGVALTERLTGLMQRYPLIGDVRGKGLLMAFELMADRATKAPLPKDLNAHARLVDIAYDNG